MKKKNVIYLNLSLDKLSVNFKEKLPEFYFFVFREFLIILENEAQPDIVSFCVICNEYGGDKHFFFSKVGMVVAFDDT